MKIKSSSEGLSMEAGECLGELPRLLRERTARAIDPPDYHSVTRSIPIERPEGDPSQSLLVGVVDQFAERVHCVQLGRLVGVTVH